MIRSLKSRGTATWAYGISGLAALVALWWLGAYWLQSGIPLASALRPGPAFASLYELVGQNHLTSHTLMSLKRVAVGLGLALLMGVPIGLAIGSSRILEKSTSSAFQFSLVPMPSDDTKPIPVMTTRLLNVPPSEGPSAARRP